MGRRELLQVVTPRLLEPLVEPYQTPTGCEAQDEEYWILELHDRSPLR
jgi:hypothetical protein